MTALSLSKDMTETFFCFLLQFQCERETYALTRSSFFAILEVCNPHDTNFNVYDLLCIVLYVVKPV